MWDFFSEIDTNNLASDAKWAVIRAGVEIAITEGISQTALASILRDNGISFSNDPFRALYRELSDYRPAFEYSAKLGGDLSPNPDLMPFGKFEIEGNYGYVGQVNIVDPTTGLLTERTFRLDSDIILTRNEAYSALYEFAQDRQEHGSGEIIDFAYIGSFKNIA